MPDLELADSTAPPPSSVATRRPVGGTVVACLFLVTAGIHVGIVAADTGFYRTFADASYLGFVRSGWSSVFMAVPVFWGVCLAVGEAALGVLLLVGGRAARLGWCGVIAFHVLLMLFGFGIWLYCLPALAVLVALATREWPRLGSPATSRTPRVRD